MVNAVLGFLAMVSVAVAAIGCLISHIAKKPTKPWVIAVIISLVVFFAAIVATNTGHDTGNNQTSEETQTSSDYSGQPAAEPAYEEKEEIKSVVGSYIDDNVVTVVENDDGTFFVGITAIDFQRFSDNDRCAEFAAWFVDTLIDDRPDIAKKISSVAIGMVSDHGTNSVRFEMSDYLAGSEIIVTNPDDAKIAEEERRYADAVEMGKKNFAEAYHLYKENPLRADDEYKGKRMMIAGTVVGMEDGGIVNIGGGVALTMRTSVETPTGTVRAEYVAEFEKDEVELIKSINVGDELAFEGECSDIGWWNGCKLR